MNYKRFYTFILAVFVTLFNVFQAHASHGEEHAGEEKKGFDAKEVIFGHISDAHDWHFFSLGSGHDATHVSIPLPVIVYKPNAAPQWNVFSSSRFHHGHETYQGLKLNEKGKIEAVDGSKIYNFSITKNVASMLLSVILLILIMNAVAKRYKKNHVMTAPNGLQNGIESIICFVRDEVAIPNIGKKHYKRFMPLLLTIFFFIWINNMLGLLPGGANLTGNIAFTACLAIITFVVMVVSGNKHFWGHLLNPPGVPTGVKFLLVPIEIISLFIKPIALMVRLFANIMAGHIIILCIVSLIFIFGALAKVAGVGFIPVSVAFSIFMFMIELMVAAIQAFIFTNLASVFIGQSVEEGHHHEEAHAHH